MKDDFEADRLDATLIQIARVQRNRAERFVGAKKLGYRDPAAQALFASQDPKEHGDWQGRQKLLSFRFNLALNPVDSTELCRFPDR